MAKTRRIRPTRRAIFPGSFDPITNGHVDLIERGLRLFDELVVAVGVNPAKKGWFDLEERIALVRASIGDPQVQVVSFVGLLVDAAREHRANVILRGEG